MRRSIHEDESQASRHHDRLGGVAGTGHDRAVGLACDVAYTLMTAHQLQNAADAAALAGAAQIRQGEDAVRQKAFEVALANTAARDPVQVDLNAGNAPEGDVVLGSWDLEAHTFTPQVTGANSVKVVARRTSSSANGPLSIVFGNVFGISTVDIERTAIAYYRGNISAGMIVLCEDCRCGLRFGGDVNITIEEDEGMPEGTISIHNNSNDDCATCGSGSSLTVVVDQINMVGTSCWAGNPDIQAEVNERRDVAPDPLAQLPAPTWDPSQDLGRIRHGGTYGPGYYSDGIDITNQDVVLEPGIYILGGSGLDVSGTSSLIAEGVLFYIIDDGVVDLTGTGDTRISPSQTVGDPYRGISIFQARDNTNEARIIGTSNMDLDGTYYFPVAPVEVGGTGGSLGNQIIAWELYVHGDGVFDIDYNGQYPIESNRSFLVH
jgi:hypothetical protein